MSYQKDREEFITIATREGLPHATALKLLRSAAVLNRLAEAVCNGDYPADNGERKVRDCPKCQGRFCPRTFKTSKEMFNMGTDAKPAYVRPPVNLRPKIPAAFHNPVLVCPDCHEEERVRAALPAGFGAVFQGDPRGCCFKLTVPSGFTNDVAKEGVCVPVRM